MSADALSLSRRPSISGIQSIVIFFRDWLLKLPFTLLPRISKTSKLAKCLISTPAALYFWTEKRLFMRTEITTLLLLTILIKECRWPWCSVLYLALPYWPLYTNLKAIWAHMRPYYMLYSRMSLRSSISYWDPCQWQQFIFGVLFSISPCLVSLTHHDELKNLPICPGCHLPASIPLIFRVFSCPKADLLCWRISTFELLEYVICFKWRLIKLQAKHGLEIYWRQQWASGSSEQRSS